MKYLALGDSYTIGESVNQTETFPYQLVTKLSSDSDLTFEAPKMIAKTGWTTGELLKGIKQARPKSDFDLVTLLIGVNNQYRAYSIEEYKTELQTLINQTIQFANGNASHVILVSIPDYGVTPFGKEMAQKIDLELRAFNQVGKELAMKNHLHWVDIFQISKAAEQKPDLLASDNLHPSEKMYQLWVEEIYMVAKTIF